MRRPKVLISTVILLIIGLHAVPVVDAGLRKRIWPFLDWAMYKDPIAPGPIQTERRRIVGVTAQGAKEEITNDDLALSSFAMERQYLQPMKAGDSTTVRQLFTQLNKDRADPFVELRLEMAVYRATKDGVVEDDQPAVVYVLDPSQSR
ncbi:MAG: hypothetical protein ACREL3_09255 [Gemmatimonadales bacterium]